MAIALNLESDSGSERSAPTEMSALKREERDMESARERTAT